MRKGMDGKTNKESKWRTRGGLQLLTGGGVAQRNGMELHQGRARGGTRAVGMALSAAAQRVLRHHSET